MPHRQEEYTNLFDWISIFDPKDQIGLAHDCTGFTKGEELHEGEWFSI